MFFKKIFHKSCDFANRLPRWMNEIDDNDCDIEILYPATMRKGTISKHLPGQLERITSVAFDGSVRQEIEQFLGDERRIGPTLRFTLKKCFVNRGVIYSGNKRKIISSFHKKLGPHETNSVVDCASIRSSFVGSYFFGHWLRDDCATSFVEDEGTKFFTPTPEWPDKKLYTKRLGICVPTAGLLYTNNLIFYNDISQNEHKIERIRSLRHIIMPTFTRSSPPDIVYLSRGNGGTSRLLVNESEIIEQLSQRGVYCLSPEDLNSQFDRISGCRLFISVEGSQISHAVYSVREGGGILALQPPNRFFNSHMDWAVPMGIQYGSVVGLPEPNGFRIPVTDILKTIDLYI